MNNSVLSILTDRVQNHGEEIRAAQKAYVIAEAVEETIKEAAEDIQKKILSENEYFIMPEYEGRRGIAKRITEPKRTYMMNEEIFLNDFLAKCYEEYQKAGIADSRGKEYCPEANAHDAKKEAENLLLKLAIELIPDELAEEKETLRKAVNHWKYREQILDLILKLGV
ncbi:MAG: hypothetical protein NC485_12235 [Ruminococcus flavefaciens]|nr:hypothetical protein [Ruminococcus flavefaciens]MCM1060087.1 hypothetical protein [Eubacterium sp.]